MKNMFLLSCFMLHLSSGVESEGGGGVTEDTPAQPKMRAKFLVTGIEKLSDSYQNLKMCAVGPDFSKGEEFGSNGENEDNSFAYYSPSGDLTMGINNPALMDKLKEGEKYYLDFTLAP